ncbi:tetratricopeptide repeat protein [Candidatus Uhrbacteria bacterium]|nr:tetratricopeptide repeat protein [Candidatus Uhrbacteria bacterium]
MKKNKTNMIIFFEILIGIVFLIGLGYYGSRHQPPSYPVNISQELRIRLLAQTEELQEKIRKSQENSAQGEDHFYEYVDLGNAYQELGMYRESRTAYLEAAKIREKTILPWMNLAYLYERAGQSKDALAAFQKVLEYDDANLDAYLHLIRLQRDIFKFPLNGIIILYQQASAKTGDNPELHRDFARYLEKMGYKNDALEQWKAVNGRLHDDLEAQEGIRRLDK